MKVLIVHHLEMTWCDGYAMHYTSFDQEAEKLLQYLEDNNYCYDRIILTLFENWELQPEHYYTGLAEHIDEVHTYGYGWTEETVENSLDNIEWIEGGCHSDFLPIYDWIKNLKGHEVHLCGAFDGECIDDMETALAGAEVEYKRISELIV